MKTVGVRDLKNRLSEYLRRVRLGESVLVTDRGEVVAELQPPGHGQSDTSVPPGLLALAKRGTATLGSPGSPRRGGGSLADAVNRAGGWGSRPSAISGRSDSDDGCDSRRLAVDGPLGGPWTGPSQSGRSGEAGGKGIRCGRSARM